MATQTMSFIDYYPYLEYCLEEKYIEGITEVWNGYYGEKEQDNVREIIEDWSEHIGEHYDICPDNFLDLVEQYHNKRVSKYALKNKNYLSCFIMWNDVEALKRVIPYEKIEEVKYILFNLQEVPSLDVLKLLFSKHKKELQSLINDWIPLVVVTNKIEHVDYLLEISDSPNAIITAAAKYNQKELLNRLISKESVDWYYVMKGVVTGKYYTLYGIYEEHFTRQMLNDVVKPTIKYGKWRALKMIFKKGAQAKQEHLQLAVTNGKLKHIRILLKQDGIDKEAVIKDYNYSNMNYASHFRATSGIAYLELKN